MIPLQGTKVGLLHLLIHPDGNIWTVDVVESSGSHSLGTPQFVRERFSVVMERMVNGLRGTPLRRP